MATDAALPPDRSQNTSDHPSLMDWQGRVLGERYRLQELVGSGAVGVVYSAHDMERDQPAAIKVLGDAGGFQTVSRFEREGQTTSRLNHPHIVETLGYGVSDGVPYLAMELLEGMTLEQRLEDEEPLPLDQALSIATQILEGLAYAHRMDVVHRDLKPGNVFLEAGTDGQYQVKLLDFGLAKLLSPDTSGASSTLTRPGMVLGTPLYMAPEQATGGQVNRTADVYSAGAVLFELLTGRPPFLEENTPNLIKAHLLEPAPLVSKLREGLPDPGGFDALLQRAMAKEPGARFQDANEMLEALSVLTAVVSSTSTGQAAKRKLAVPASTEPASHAHRMRIWGAAAVLLLLPAYLLLSASDEDAAAAARRGLPVPRDVWKELGVPEPLSEYYKRVEAGEGIGREEMRDIQAYAREHDEDPRPYLLLGRGFANRFWRKDAIQRYLWAFRTDASSRGDPHMLPNLLEITAHDTHGALACKAIKEIYGAEALAEVRREAEEAPPGSPHADRLHRLAEQLAAESQ